MTFKKIIASNLVLSVALLSACSNASTASEAPQSQVQQQTQQTADPIAQQSPSADASAWTIIPAESHIKFTATQTGKAFTGQFTDFTATIILDPDDLANASINTVITLASADAGDKDRNSALPGKEWFYVKKFPQAVFTSDTLTKTGDTSYEAAGTLTIRDVSQPVTLPFNMTITDDRADMSGNLTLNRGDFGVGQGAWETDEWVSLDVGVDIKVAATR